MMQLTDLLCRVHADTRREFARPCERIILISILSYMVSLVPETTYEALRGCLFLGDTGLVIQRRRC